jgi:glycosyltransferase involved in cell wall biosynthesis
MPNIHFGLGSLSRELRVRKTSVDGSQARLTVFLGIYNARPFLEDLVTSIRNQNWTTAVNLLIVDNSSTDSSLELLENELPSMESKVTFVRNVQNVGALGSLYRNADLVETEWVTFMHQDDLYLPNFLESCLREISQLKDAPVTTISFDYQTAEGDVAPAHSPNPTWFARGTPSFKAFLENLANHAIPWPCTVFRTSYLLQSPVPFHSAAFLDTEIALNQVSLGQHRYVSEVVMNYRIHGESGSHSLPMAEAETLRCVSMLRVFHSQAFRALVLTVPKDIQGEWASAVVQSSLSYLNSTSLRNLLALSVLESIVIALEYGSHDVNELLATELSRIGADGPAILVSGLIRQGSAKFPNPRTGSNTSSGGGHPSSGDHLGWVRRLLLKLPKFWFVLIFRLTPKRFIPPPWSNFK